MAYFKGNGDVVQTSYVQKTLEEKSYIIPGKTCIAELEFVDGETVKYWVRDTSSLVTTGSLGQAISATPKALVSKSLTIGKRVAWNEPIPGVNIATVTADQINEQLIKETIAAGNKINEDYITALVSAASAATATYNAADAYGSLLTLQAEFETENKVEGVKPTAVFVSPAVYASLVAKNLVNFKEGFSVFEYPVIKCPDLPSGTNAILLSEKAMIAPINFRANSTYDARPAGYADGVGIIGEIGYEVAAAETDADFAGKLVLSF